MPPGRLSYAAALAALRHAAHTNPSTRVLRSRLRRAVLDARARRGRKSAYRWPHKKNPRPPGPPIITTATPSQARRAQALRARLNML